MGLRDALGGLLGGDDPPAEVVEDPAAPPVPADAVREAADDAAAERPDLDLDFSLDSLTRLDAYAARQDAAVDPDADTDALLEHDEVFALGAYFGETLIRQFGGAWEYQGGWSVHLAPDGAVVEVPAFDVAARSLTEEPSFRQVAEAAADELDAAATFGDPSLPADDGAPESAERYREGARKLVASWPDYDLDGTVVSLAYLDDIVDSAGETAGDSASLDALAGYVAEVLHREHDATWDRRDGAAVVVLTGPDGEATIDPYTLSADALAGDASFVTTYAEAAADCGLEPPGVD